MQTLATLISLAGLIPFILVLIKLFQEKGALHGILGLICGLYTFIWGWMNAERLGIKNLMLLWTALIIASFVLAYLGGGVTAPAGLPAGE
jgi:hypothetical protein